MVIAPAIAAQASSLAQDGSQSPSHPLIDVFEASYKERGVRVAVR
jgi:hypothetical protein